MNCSISVPLTNAKCLLLLKVKFNTKKPASMWHQHSWENSRFKLVFHRWDWVIFKVFSHSASPCNFIPGLFSFLYHILCILSLLALKSEGSGGDHKGDSKSSEGTSLALLWSTHPYAETSEQTYTVFSLFVGQTTSAFIAGFYLLLLPLHLEYIVSSLSVHR